MEKVKLTKSQAEEIEIIKRSGHPVYWKEDGWLIERSENLVGLSFQSYMNAIYKGYEIESEFKIGDWVFTKTKTKRIGKVVKITNRGEIIHIDHKHNTALSGYKNFAIKNVGHATPEEIATEKRIRWWAKHDRDVWKLEEDDELIKRVRPATFRVIEQDEHETTVFELNRTETGYIKIKNEHLERNYNIKFFSEDRKDI